MIKSLAINNFQSHEKTYLKFDSGVNVIVGPSDTGKTAIIRALRWIVWNRPSGDAIRSHWGGDTFAILETENGFIWRHKGKIDKYELKAYGKNSLVFKAFGTAVPEEISKFLNINEINLQRQLDSPFLLSNSPGERAQHFNKIAKLDKIDSGLYNINSWIREINSSTKYKEEQVESLEEGLKKFNHIEKFEADLEVLETMNDQLRSLKSTLDNLQLLLYDYNECSRFIGSYDGLISNEKAIDNLLALFDKKKEEEKELMELEGVVEDVRVCESEIKAIEGFVKDEEQIDIILDLYQKKHELEQEYANFSAFVNQLKSTTHGLEIEERKYKISKENFDKICPDICPFCDQPITNKKHKHNAKDKTK